MPNWHLFKPRQSIVPGTNQPVTCVNIAAYASVILGTPDLADSVQLYPHRGCATITQTTQACFFGAPFAAICPLIFSPMLAECQFCRDECRGQATWANRCHSSRIWISVLCGPASCLRGLDFSDRLLLHTMCLSGVVRSAMYLPTSRCRDKVWHHGREWIRPYLRPSLVCFLEECRSSVCCRHDKARRLGGCEWRGLDGSAALPQTRPPQTGTDVLDRSVFNIWFSFNIFRDEF